jgi:hypothetical protein
VNGIAGAGACLCYGTHRLVRWIPLRWRGRSEIRLSGVEIGVFVEKTSDALGIGVQQYGKEIQIKCN